jgi:hypothetical protein
MKNILIVNDCVENCGVYQYGKRFANILCDADNLNYKFIYIELSCIEDLNLSLVKFDPYAIIYNLVPGTIPFITENTVNEIRSKKIKQLLIVHNVNYHTFFDYYLHQDPYYKPQDNLNFNLLRPIFDYTPSLNDQTDNNVINIGSFGFGFGVKHISDLCKLVNDQFQTENVNLNLHLTYSHYCNNVNEMEYIKRDCYNSINNKNININFTHNFLSDIEMLNFLHKNDLNIFLYQKYHSYNGISSCIDYALSVKKPIAICKSNMFSHIYGVTPSICIEDNRLQTILDNGFTPLLPKYNEWSNYNFTRHIENILNVI